MYIKTLSARGIKGLTFSHQLGRKVYITGPNKTGKTSRLDTVRLAIRGYAAEIGKKVQADTVGLFAKGSSFSVELDFDNGEHISRGWQLTQAGGITKTMERGIEFAESLDCPLLDPSAYFAMTDSERVNYVFAQAPDSGITVEKILADLRAVELDTTEQAEKARSEMVELCRKKLVLAGINVGLDELTKPKVGLLSMEFTSWNRKATETLGAVKTLTELKNREGECSAETVASLTRDLETIKTRGEQARTELAGLEQRKMTADRTAKRRGELDAILSKPFEGDQEIEMIRSRMAGRLIGGLSEAEAKRNQLREAVQATTKAAAEASRDVAHWEAGLKKAEGEKAEIDGLECCPKCEGKPKNWKGKLMKRAEDLVKTLQDEVAHRNTILAEKSRDERAAMHDHNEAQKALEAILDAQRAQSSDERALGELRGKRDTFDAAKRERENLKATEPPTEKEMVDAAAELAAASREYRETNAKKDAALQLAQDLKRADESHREHTKALAYVKTIKALQGKLAEIKADLVEKVFGGFLATANTVMHGLFETPLVFKEGNIGRIEEGCFISHKTFSNSEQALCYIAIAAALSQKGKFRVVLIPDMGTVSTSDKINVLQALGFALDHGLLDQVIIADPVVTGGEQFEDLPSGWQHIDLAANRTVAQDYTA